MCRDAVCAHQEELELQANKVAYKGTPPGILGPDSQVTGRLAQPPDACPGLQYGNTQYALALA